MKHPAADRWNQTEVRFAGLKEIEARILQNCGDV